MLLFFFVAGKKELPLLPWVAFKIPIRKVGRGATHSAAHGAACLQPEASFYKGQGAEPGLIPDPCQELFLWFVKLQVTG